MRNFNSNYSNVIEFLLLTISTLNKYGRKLKIKEEYLKAMTLIHEYTQLLSNIVQAQEEGMSRALRRAIISNLGKILYFSVSTSSKMSWPAALILQVIVRSDFMHDMIY